VPFPFGVGTGRAGLNATLALPTKVPFPFGVGTGRAGLAIDDMAEAESATVAITRTAKRATFFIRFLLQNF
jgi:hypothetical protein